MWSDEEVEQGRMAWAASGTANYCPSRAEVEAIMTRSVELVAARGGTMTAEDLALRLSRLRRALASFGTEFAGLLDQSLHEIERHIAAQGARVAVLEEERDEARGNVEGNENAWRLADARADAAVAEADQLRDRLTASEDSVRELTRRAQQAEAERDAAAKLAEQRRQDRLDALSVKTTEGLSASEWVLRAGKAERERDELKARRTTLSAAGQVSSEHVDKAGNHPEIPESSTASARRLTIAELESILESPEGTYCIEVQPNGEVRAAKRYPCSPACTHDDARTPGRPERVKERSESFAHGALGLPTPEERREAMARFVDPNTPPFDPMVDLSPSEYHAYEQGAEAMRAACWEAVQPLLQRMGIDHITQHEFKHAIEGATP
jgi:hypothetical protein